jgi:uncharacterized protein (TIGR03435 family)
MQKLFFLTSVVILSVAGAVAAIHAGAQSPSPTGANAKEPVLSFEAASVKANRSGDQERFVQRQAGGRFNAKNMPLRALITFAYQIQGFQLVGGPSWIASDRFDIVAKAAGDPPPVAPGSGPDQLMFMLRTLLADRFKMAAHRETQDLPIYALVLARRDGKPGPQLRQAATDCAAQAAAARSGGPPPGPPPGPDSPVTCGMRTMPGKMLFGGMPLSQFTNGLAPQVQRVVLDRTGLAGNWDFELTYAPEQTQAPPGGFAVGVELPAADPNAPNLFTALQEQLGLKLEPARGPVEVLVIDRIEQPTED